MCESARGEDVIAASLTRNEIVMRSALLLLCARINVASGHNAMSLVAVKS